VPPALAQMPAEPEHPGSARSMTRSARTAAAAFGVR